METEKDDIIARLDRIVKAPGRATVDDVLWLVVLVHAYMIEVELLQREASRLRHLSTTRASRMPR